MSVRAKFVCNVIEPEKYQGEDAYRIVLNATTPHNSENDLEKFWKYTPSGSFEMRTVNGKAAEQFEVGKSYYIDIHEAPSYQELEAKKP